MEFWDLPTSIFEDKILSSLSVRDLASLGQVSKQFHAKVQADSVWEAMYHHHYGPRTPILKRAAEIAGGYRQLYRSRLLSDKASGPGIYRATEPEIDAFVESVIGSGGWMEGAEDSGEEAEGPVAVLFLVDTSLSMAMDELETFAPAVDLMSETVSTALLKNPACLTGAITFQDKAKTLLPLQLYTADDFRSRLFDLLADGAYFEDGTDDSKMGTGVRLAPAMALVREEFVRTNLPQAAPKCIVVLSDGLWSPDEVAEAQAAAAELCRGDLGPVRVFGVGIGKAARMDEFRGMLEAQGSLPLQASARYLTLLSDNKLSALSIDLTGLSVQKQLEACSVIEDLRNDLLGIEVDVDPLAGIPGSSLDPPPAWLVARLPHHELEVTLDSIGDQGHSPVVKGLLQLAPWVKTIKTKPGQYTMDLAPFPYSQQQLESFSNLRELALFDPESVPAIPNLESLNLAGYMMLYLLNFKKQFEGVPNLKKLTISCCGLGPQDIDEDMDFFPEDSLYDGITVLTKLEHLSLDLPGPTWSLPNLFFCKHTLKSFHFTFGDGSKGPAQRQKARQGWLSDREDFLTAFDEEELDAEKGKMIVSDVAAALSDCASLETLLFEVMSDKGLEGIEQLAGLPSLKKLMLVCSVPRADVERVQSRCLEAFSALKQVENFALVEAPTARADWKCAYTWEEGALVAKLFLRPQRQ